MSVKKVIIETDEHIIHLTKEEITVHPDVEKPELIGKENVFFSE
jgi:hypothetical protein